MPIDIDMLRRRANLEKVSRFLINYFIKKFGKEHIDRVIDPGQILDLIQQIPPLSTKVETVPHAEDMKYAENQITIGWNLFVMGTYQMYLGRNYYQDISVTVSNLRNGQYVTPLRPTEFGVTPRKIIVFIKRVLRKCEDGYVPWVNPTGIGQYINYNALNMGYHHNYGIPSDTIR